LLQRIVNRIFNKKYILTAFLPQVDEAKCTLDYDHTTITK